MALANILMAGAGAILPVVMEALRDKPDPEMAKNLLRSQRQARIEEAIGAGMSMQQAEKQVDAQLQQEFAAADEAGEFNTPWGEMIAGAVLGGAMPWAATKLQGMAQAGKFGKTIAGLAGGAATKADDVAAAAKAAKIDTPAEQALVKPASGQAPSVTPPAGMTQASPMRPEAEIAAKLESRAGYDSKRMAMDNTDQWLVDAVDERVPAMRPRGPFPEFLPGEFQSKTPAAMLRPWESMPEVEGAIIRKQLGKLKADPRGVMASMRSPFPDMESDRMRASLYGRSGG